MTQSDEGWIREYENCSESPKVKIEREKEKNLST